MIGGVRTLAARALIGDLHSGLTRDESSVKPAC
jgi:hypothetical protein